MVEYIVIMALILVAAYWVIRPLLNPEPYNRSRTSATDETIRELEVRKEGAYATILELEFDLKMGKLSNGDFEELKKQYTIEALDCIATIDALQLKEKSETNFKKEGPEEKIEEEFLEPHGKKKKEKPDIFCAQCGTRSSHQDRFCHSCGAELVKAKIKLAAV